MFIMSGRLKLWGLGGAGACLYLDPRRKFRPVAHSSRVWLEWGSGSRRPSFSFIPT